MKRITSSSLLTALLLGGAAGLFLALPDAAGRGISAGLTLCAGAVIPALLPFGVLSSLFLSSGLSGEISPGGRLTRQIFGGSGRAASVWLMGILSGFPIGGKLAAGETGKGHLSPEEGALAAAYADCPSPAFVLTFCGGFFSSRKSALLLWLCLIFASLLTAFLGGKLFLPRREKTACFRQTEAAFSRRSSSKAGQLVHLRSFDAPSSPPSPSDTACTAGVLCSLPSSVSEGGETVLRVCAFVTFFSGLMGVLEALIPGIPSSVLPLFRGFFELTAGISSLDGWVGGERERFRLAALLLSFSGLSSNLQVLSFLDPAGIPLGNYRKGKALFVLLTAALALPVSLLVG